MTTPEPGPIVVVLVELRCLQCGRDIGTLEARQWPCRGPALLRLSGTRRAVPVADWCRLRCAACGGNAYTDEVKASRRYPHVSWDDLDRPRCGRPPRWLMAERQAARDANGD